MSLSFFRLWCVCSACCFGLLLCRKEGENYPLPRPTISFARRDCRWGWRRPSQKWILRGGGGLVQVFFCLTAKGRNRGSCEQVHLMPSLRQSKKKEITQRINRRIQLAECSGETYQGFSFLFFCRTVSLFYDLSLRVFIFLASVVDSCSPSYSPLWQGRPVWIV